MSLHFRFFVYESVYENEWSPDIGTVRVLGL